MHTRPEALICEALRIGPGEREIESFQFRKVSRRVSCGGLRGLGYRVQRFGFRFQGLEFRVRLGLGFRVRGSELHVHRV